MTRILPILLLSGCATPYVYVGAGLGTTDNPGFESGAVGHYGAGLDLNTCKPPWECSIEYRHRSMINQHPEAIINDVTAEIKRSFFK